MTWLFKGTEYTEPGDHESFVYLLEIGEYKYIGVKSFYSMRKPRKGGRRVKSQSNWKSYYSSSNIVKELVKEVGKDNVRRTILSLHKTRGDANYYEVKLQFELNVLEDPTYLNETINGKWHRKPQWITDGRVIA